MPKNGGRRKSKSTPGSNRKRKLARNPLSEIFKITGSSSSSSGTPRLVRRKSLQTTPKSSNKKKKSPRKQRNAPMMLLPDNTTFDLGGLSPSQISTPVNRRITRQMSNSVGKGGGLTVEGDEANTVHAAAANRVASASKSSSMENFIPLTPRLLVKSYKSQGFFEPPVTIDETIDLTDEPQTPVQKKRPINQNSDVRKAPSSRKKPAKKRRKDVTLEDGEILDDTVDEEVQIIGDVVKSPEVVIIHDALDSNRSQSPKKTPKWKKLYKNAKSKISSRRVRWEGSKNPTGSRGRKSNRLANAQVNAGSKNSYNLNPVPTFNPNAAPNTNFTSGLAMVQGGVFHFKGGRDRIVPTMGTRQLSTKTMHGMSNVYVPTPDKSANQSGPRPIIIDGSNVAFAHSQSSGNHYFSSRGIDICVEYFKRRGHPEVIAFIPQHRMKHGQSVDRHLLEKLKKTGNLACTPSRSLQTQSIASYDDRYIVQYASVKGGIIVSNDNYRDLVEEDPLMRETVESRLLMFNWVAGDTLMFPQDPLGRHGPNLDTFLMF